MPFIQKKGRTGREGGGGRGGVCGALQGKDAHRRACEQGRLFFPRAGIAKKSSLVPGISRPRPKKRARPDRDPLRVKERGGRQDVDVRPLRHGVEKEGKSTTVSD